MSDVTGFEQAVELALTLSPVEKVRLVEQVMATLEQDLTRSSKNPKHSVYGSWSGVNVSSEDLDEARHEIWGMFPREDI